MLMRCFALTATALVLVNSQRTTAPPGGATVDPRATVDPAATAATAPPGATLDPGASYIYVKNSPSTACTSTSMVATLADCQGANVFMQLPKAVVAKVLGNSPFGCYWYDAHDGPELHYNSNLQGPLASDSHPVCKVPGSTTTVTTTSTIPPTRPPRDNPNCSNDKLRSDGYCDPGNNNELCNWDKKPDTEGAVSDCCVAVDAEFCKDPALCKCLDPAYKAPPTTTSTTAPPTTPGKVTTPKTTTKDTATTTADTVTSDSATTKAVSNPAVSTVTSDSATTKAVSNPEKTTSATKTTTTARSSCHDFTKGDGICDPQNNNAACGYDKKDGKNSDCCIGVTAACLGSSKCACLDPDYIASPGLVPTLNIVLWMAVVWCSLVFAA